MTEEIIKSMSLNRILISILQEHGTLTVPTLKFVDAGADVDKELIVEYDEENLAFKFSVRDKSE